MSTSNDDEAAAAAALRERFGSSEQFQQYLLDLVASNFRVNSSLASSNHEEESLSEQDILNRLVTFTFDNSNGSNEECAICKESYASGDTLASLACLHRFHFACIRQCLLLKPLCPLCRLNAFKPTTATTTTQE